MKPMVGNYEVDDDCKLDQDQCIICGGEGVAEPGFIVSDPDLEEFWRS